jgi:hypothetical protein
MRNSVRFAFASLLFTAACNNVTTGDDGTITFTPDDCGQAWCSLDDRLAVGTSVEVTLGAVDGYDSDVAHLTLVSDDPTVAVTFPLPAVGASRWQVLATGRGVTRLVALEGNRYVDGTALFTESAYHLGLEVEYGPAFASEVISGPVSEEVWHFPAGEHVTFRVRPFDRHGHELAGKLNLGTELDNPLFDALSSASDVPAGKLALLPMFAGDFGLSAYGPEGLVLDVFFEVR